MRKSTQLNVQMLLLTVLMGIVAWLISLWTYDLVVDTLPRPLTIGLMFALLSLFVGLGVFIISTVRGTFEENIMINGSSASVLMIALLAPVLFIALGALFQWIYGLHINPDLSEPTSYVFVIDDSGSMEGNDPSQLRYEAIGEVLEKKPSDFPYMVYGFADDVTLLREMQPVSAGTAGLIGNSNGGTSIKSALDQVISDYQKGVWNGGTTPKVILLTDGYATDLGWFSSINGTLKQYARNRISVSTVGLGDVDLGLMERIAAATGGVFIDISDAASLADAMDNAATQYAVDDLLTMRYPGRMDVLFGFLRILFISLLGICIGLLKSIAYGQMDSSTLTVISSAIQSVVGAIVMELFTSLMGVSDRMCWFALWLLITATVCTKQETYRRAPYRPSRRSGRSARNLR